MATPTETPMIEREVRPEDKKTLRGWREYFILTQDQMAEIVGVSPASLGNYERGVRAIQIRRQQQVAAAMKARFGVGFEQIIWPTKDSAKAAQ
jgi:DNA-binding XRE family transcriptional regulator